MYRLTLVSLVLLLSLAMGLTAGYADDPDGDWHQLGNAGTDASDFVGTTDAVDLNFRTSNVQRMKIASDGGLRIKNGIADANANTFLVQSSDGFNIFNVDTQPPSRVVSVGPGSGSDVSLLVRSNTVDAFSVRSADAVTRHLTVDAVNGRVGIGTGGFPSAKLEVVGDTELNGNVTINSDLTVDTDTLFVDGTSDRVGIGTTSPFAVLDVVATGPGIPLQVDGRFASPGTIEDLVVLRRRTDPIAPGLAANGIGAGLNFVVQRFDGNNVSAARIAGILPDAVTGDGALIFETGPFGSSLERMRIAADGNVGIGTTSPSAKLDVVGTTELNGNVTINSDLTVDTDTLFVDGTNNNVGIGTATPLTPLDVAGTGDVLTLRDTGSPSKMSVFLASGTNTLNSNKNLNLQTTVSGTLFLSTSGAERMRITPGGDVGIGTINPQAKLDVEGKIRVGKLGSKGTQQVCRNPSSGILSLCSARRSDARLKTNVAQLTDVLDKLEQIRGVSFEWNDSMKSMGMAKEGRNIGVIAQELETVFPELVDTFGEEGYKTVDYQYLTAVLIEAVKELNAENKDLHAKNVALEVRLTSVEQSLGLTEATPAQLSSLFSGTSMIWMIGAGLGLVLMGGSGLVFGFRRVR